MSSAIFVGSVLCLAAFDPLPPRATRRTVRVHNAWEHQYDYAETLAWQRRLLAKKTAAVQAGSGADLSTNSGGPDDALLVLQHPPVLTLGTSSTLDNLRSDTQPFELFRTERGGEVTYHGPGQLVLYPVLDLRAYKQDVHWYMRALEEVVIRALGDLGLSATREPGLTGVWVDGAKACAIGVKLSRWVSMHGLALNVVTDLSHFEHIVPCGIADKPVTSVQRLQSRVGGGGDEDVAAESRRLLDAAQAALLRNFASVFEVNLEFEDLESGELAAEREATNQI